MKVKYLGIITLMCLFFSFDVFGQCTRCENTTNNGINSSAIGKGTQAIGQTSFASGAFSTAYGDGSTSIGFRNLSSEIYTTTIGSFLKATASHAMVIGDGYGLNMELVNNNAYSLMFAFHSTKPTLFISTSPGYLKTGKIAIGNVVNQYGQMEPLAKLHLRADEGEAAAIYVQPHNWLGGDVAGIYLGNFLHGIKADTNMGITFLSEKDYVFGAGNVGLGVEQPKAKLHIDGNILFENPADGFIMKSENGQCWKVTINNDGSFNSTMVGCENFSGTQNNKEDQHTPLYFYPNPTSGLLKIDNRSNTNGWVVEFRSLNGTLLKSDNLASGTNQFDLNFAADGMLIVSVYDQQGNMVTSEKIVVK